MSKNTVTVGCKLPNGLVIEVDDRSAVLNGANSSEIIGGHGITEHVDADLFREWMKRHADRDMVKNGFVFAHEKGKNTKAEAQEKAGNKTRLEPIVPDNKGNGVETAKED